MNNLKKIRKAAGVAQAQLAAHIQAIEPRYREADVCRLEGGVNMPTAEQLVLICQLFGVDPTDIYTKEEMNLAGCLKRAFPAGKKEVKDKTLYKLTVTLPGGLASGLDLTAATLGYESKSDLIRGLLEEAKERAKKIAPTVGAAETKPKDLQTTLRVPEKGGDVNAF